MPALITVNTEYTGRPHVCDARCYSAIGPDCNCVCGGMNHKVGYEQALANTQALARNMVADFITKEGKEESFIRVKVFDGQKLRRMDI